METSKFLEERFGIGKEVEIPNMDRHDLPTLFHELGFTKGAEIGVERGVYSKTICQRMLGVKLFLVDPWKAYRGYREHVSQEKLDGFYEETKERLRDYDVELVRKFSVDAAKDFENESLDFAYLDGNHEYSHVVNDLTAWVPKVKIGGIVSGHDFISRKNPEYLMGVIPAVRGYQEAYRIPTLYIIGRKERIEGEKRDNTRSWMFVKERNYYSCTQI